MKAGRVLALVLRLLLALPALGLVAGSAKAEPREENGGVIILHAEFHFTKGHGTDATIVVVASNDEYAALTLALGSNLGGRCVHIEASREDAEFDALLQRFDGDRVTGRVYGSHQRIMVVTHDYAQDYYPEEIW